MKGRDQGQSLLSRPQAALPSLAQQPRARRIDGQPPGSHSGNIHSYCRWANRRILLSLENILETPMKKTCFSDWLMGLKRDSCLPGSGRTQGPGKVSRPEAATPQVCSSTSIITCTAGRPAHWVPTPDSPHTEDWCCSDHHQLQLPLRTVVPASGFVYSDSWTGGHILVRGEFGLGVCLLVVVLFFLMTMK